MTSERRRILVYEFASGGGLAGRDVPPSLAREGAAMRAALVADLAAIGCYEIVTTADPRVTRDLPRGVEVVTLPAGDRAREAALDRAIDSVDAVWLIAPETDRCLERLARRVARRRKTLLGMDAGAIARASDKAALGRRLAALGISHPQTRRLTRGFDAARAAARIRYPIVVKPARGAGSDGISLVRHPAELPRAVATARRASGRGGVLMQEYVRGTPASVSLIADGRRAVALSVNEQIQGCLRGSAASADQAASPPFAYRGGRTPFDHPLAPRAIAAALDACRAVAGLRGFVGVDVVLTESDVVVIEINPRLTTAYLGVRAAVDENVAALAIAACAGDLPVAPRLRRSIRFSASGRITSCEPVGREPGAAGRLGSPDDRASFGETGVRSAILGWDVGGANIKVARVDGRSRSPQAVVVEYPFALWREFNRLPSVLAELAHRVGPTPVMALTMTAELADCFATKREGVAAVIDAVERAFPASALRVYGVDGRFLSPEEARRQPLAVAAANWLASATLAAREHRDALLLDVGSTTTDIIPIVAGRVAAIGRTDPERLRSGELVYTGCLRTPVSAVVRSLPLAGGRCRVAAEHFAITADVYRWLGRLAECDYSCDTPDGRGRSRFEAGARLARMVCADSETLSDSDVTAIANHVAGAQTRQIAAGIRQVARRLGAESPGVALVAGSGAFVARAAAESLGLVACDPVGGPGADVWRAAPAAAVAYLLAEQAGARGFPPPLAINRRELRRGSANQQSCEGGSRAKLSAEAR